MHYNALVSLLLAASQLAVAAPSTQASTYKSLRLIKTSASDPGQWVESADFFEKFTSKGINFIDITDIEDEEVLAILSGVQPKGHTKTRAPAYPEQIGHAEEANGLIAKSSTTGPKSWLKTLSDFHTRYYTSKTGTDASNWIFENAKKLAGSNSAITVKQFKHKYNQPSVIATIPGNSPNLVIVGAHLDSTGGSATARSPGADDDGSGSVTIMEAFRVLAASGKKPQNTLEFHWYSGEEAGLLGSKDVFASYKKQGKTVVGMLQQDMTGYSPSGKPAVITDSVDASLTDFVFKIATEYTGAEPNTSECGYGCSDHASASANGFPSAFVFEDEFNKSNPNIHSSRDTYDIIQWDAVERHIKLTIGYLVELSYVEA